MKFYYVTNIFDLHTFDNETTALLKFFEICTEIHFVFLFFLNEKNISTSLLIIHLKCDVMYCYVLFPFTIYNYANLNSSSLSKPYLRAVEYAILLLFDILYIFILMKLLSKILLKKLSLFNTNFQNSFRDVVYYRYYDVKLCDTKLAAFWIQGKNWKKGLFF